MGSFSHRRAEHDTSAQASTGPTPPARVWLDVPFAEKDAAKALGARFDGAARRWYAPPGKAEALSKWAAFPDIPDMLPGEDRSFGAGLFVDLVPSSCWFTNVRSCVTAKDWERLRRMILGRAGQRCEACGQVEDRPSKRWLEAHERWAYDDDRGVQTLRRLVCLCTACHTVTHFGLAQLQGRDTKAFAHLCAVTGMTDRQGNDHVDAAFDLWRQRSTRTWALELGMLTTAGITLARPPTHNDRVRIAEQTLRRYR
ncbi:MAG: hypothetical protein JO281_05050 [Pseudonocardiales bacterium]|nr:hypothetical protein [Pseudonocardiales bacterium]